MENIEEYLFDYILLIGVCLFAQIFSISFLEFVVKILLGCVDKLISSFLYPGIAMDCSAHREVPHLKFSYFRILHARLFDSNLMSGGHVHPPT